MTKYVSLEDEEKGEEMEVASWRPILAPTVSGVCAILVFISGDSDYWRKFWSIAASVLKLVIVLSMLPGALKGVVYVTEMIPFTPGINLIYRVDVLGLYYGTVSSFLWVVTTIYAIGYMKPEHAKTRFFGFFALCVSSTVGIAFAGNLITLFITYEMLTICAYPLVIHEETPEAMKAGRKYLVYTLSGGALIFFAIALTYYLTGTMTLSKPGILNLSQGTTILYVLFVLYIVGFGVKAAIMPLHGWLPSAMVAPTPVSALLHAVAVVKAGVFGILRVTYNVFGVDLMKELGVGPILAYIAAFTIITGSVMALMQDNLKRRLAYSTISQLSYIVLGAALLTPLAATAAIVHLANQAFQKITMFFVAGAIQRKTGKLNISELDGIGHQMPFTMAGFTIAALGFTGVPLLAGFITKWYLSLGALEAGQPVFIGVMLVSALLNAFYWLPVVNAAYFKNPRPEGTKIDEADGMMLYPILFCALWVIVLGTMAEVPGMPLSLARAAVEMVFKMK